MANASFFDDQFSFASYAWKRRPVAGREEEIKANFKALVDDPLADLRASEDLALSCYELCGLPTKPGYYLLDRGHHRFIEWVSYDHHEIKNNHRYALLFQMGHVLVLSRHGLGAMVFDVGLPVIASNILQAVDYCRSAIKRNDASNAVLWSGRAARDSYALELELTQAKYARLGHKNAAASLEGAKMRAASPKRAERNKRICRRFLELRLKNPFLTKSGAIRLLQKPGEPGYVAGSGPLSRSSLYEIVKICPEPRQTGQTND